jgi:hypothetical protein
MSKERSTGVILVSSDDESSAPNSPTEYVSHLALVNQHQQSSIREKNLSASLETTNLPPCSALSTNQNPSLMDFAIAFNVSTQAVSQLLKIGMPSDSISAAAEWRLSLRGYSPTLGHIPKTFFKNILLFDDPEMGPSSGIGESLSCVTDSESALSTTPFNPIPPPLLCFADDNAEDFDDAGTQQTNAACATSSLSRSSKQRPNMTSPHQEHQKIGDRHLVANTNLATNSSETESSSNADGTLAMKSSKIESMDQPISFSTQTSGIGRYTGGFNLAGQFHGQGTFEWIGESAWEGDKYEGMWVNGEKNGHGIYTSADGTTFDGFWVGNKKNGHGCTVYNSDGRSLLSSFTWSEGDMYDGEFVDNVRHGACEYTWFNGEKRRYVWENGVCHEWSKRNAEILNMFRVSAAHLELVGRLDLLLKLRKACLDDGFLVFCETTDPLLEIGFDSKTATGLLQCIPKLQTVHLELPNVGVYKGDTFNGVFHGRGVMNYQGGNCYDGSWRHGLRDGFGIMNYQQAGSDAFGVTWSKGDQYKGEFKMDSRHGTGEYTWSTGEKLTSIWTKGSCGQWMQKNADVLQSQLPGHSHTSDVSPKAMIASFQVSQMVQAVDNLIGDFNPRSCFKNDSSLQTKITHLSSHEVHSTQLSSLSFKSSGQSDTNNLEGLGNPITDETVQRPNSIGNSSPVQTFHQQTFNYTESRPRNVPSQRDIAHALGYSTGWVAELKRKGMPVHSIAAAQEWKQQYLQAIQERKQFESKQPAQRASTSDGKRFVILSEGTQYEGECDSEGKFHGKGKLTLPCGDTYFGEFSDGKKHGSGTYMYANQSFYNGQWKNGFKHGSGVSVYKAAGGSGNYTWSAGDIFDGEFQDNHRHGPCEYTWFNGQKMRCVWHNGQCPEWTQKNTEILQSMCRSRDGSPNPASPRESSVPDSFSLQSSSEESTSPPPARRPPGVYRHSPPLPRQSSTPPLKRALPVQNSFKPEPKYPRGMDKNGWYVFTFLSFVLNVTFVSPMCFETTPRNSLYVGINDAGFATRVASFYVRYKLLACLLISCLIGCEYGLPPGDGSRAICAVRNERCTL